MNQTCPIHPEVVDDRAARIGAGLVILVAAFGTYAGRPWVALALALDFALRSRGLTSWSPIARLAKGLRVLSGMAPRPTNAGPKRFAALLGTLLSLAIALAFGLRHPRPALILTAILLLCASLEAFLGYCLGCKVYSLVLPFLGARWRSPAPPS